MLGNLNFTEILMILPVVIVALTIHEFAHTYTALLLGDDTAKEQGRLTLNPLKHIDPLGFLMLVIAGFGWAKPVQIDRNKLKNPTRDDILIALAGPVSNLVLAVLAVLLLKAVLPGISLNNPTPLQSRGLQIIYLFISINIGLGLFNLLPFPPLDGSHFLLSVLLKKNPQRAMQFYRYGSYLLLGIIILERIIKVDILPIGKAVQFVIQFLFRIFSVGGA